MVDNQSAFWSLHPYVYGKIFPAFPFSPVTATVATKRKNGKGKTERHNGTTEPFQNGTAKATATEWWKPGISLDIIHILGTIYSLIIIALYN